MTSGGNTNEVEVEGNEEFESGEVSTENDKIVYYKYIVKADGTEALETCSYGDDGCVFYRKNGKQFRYLYEYDDDSSHTLSKEEKAAFKLAKEKYRTQRKEKREYAKAYDRLYYADQIEKRNQAVVGGIGIGLTTGLSSYYQSISMIQQQEYIDQINYQTEIARNTPATIYMNGVALEETGLLDPGLALASNTYPWSVNSMDPRFDGYFHAQDAANYYQPPRYQATTVIPTTIDYSAFSYQQQT